MIKDITITFIASAILWMTYRALFSNSNRFQFNRFMLLSLTAFAFVLPFVSFTLPTQLPSNVAVSEYLSNHLTLQEAVVTAQNASSTKLTWIDAVSLIYIIGIVAYFVKLLVNVLKIHKMAKSNTTEDFNGYHIVRTGKEHIPYSFLNYIFLPEGETDTQIIRHEISHVRHQHTFDVLFIEILTAFQWFNPIMRIIKKDLQNIHEYTADRDVIDNGADKTDYMMLILQQCTATELCARPSASTAIGNNFSFSLTKKRIQMITQKKKTRGLIFKALLTLPVLALLLFANCNNASKNNESIKEETSTIKVNLNEGTSVVATHLDEEGQEQDTEVFTICEEQPEYPGGMDALASFISENIQYPQSAKENGIEGICFIQFVIDTDGSITDVECLKSVDPDCDAEAMRVVKAMPNWIPGKNNGEPIRVSYNLPINFKLQ